MFLRSVRFVALVLCLSVLSSCTLLPKAWPFRKKRVLTAQTPRAQNAGTILLVNETSKFVLIDSGDFPTPAVGTTLTSYTAGVESATLLATEVRKRPHLIADITSGAPHKGDRVIALPTLRAEPNARRAEAVQPTPAPAKKKPFWKFW